MKLDKQQIKLTKIAVEALEDIKARDIVVLDVRKMTALYDTLIIATAESSRQTKALANNVREEVKGAGGVVVGSEGEESGDWVLVDCADFVVHIMLPAVRSYYNLEELWTPPEPTRKAEKPAVKKPAAKKAATKTAEKKPAVKKAAVKKVVAKKTAVKKAPVATKPAVKKVAAKKVAAKKVAAKKTTAAPQSRRRLKDE